MKIVLWGLFYDKIIIEHVFIKTSISFPFSHKIPIILPKTCETFYIFNCGNIWGKRFVKSPTSWWVWDIYGKRFVICPKSLCRRDIPIKKYAICPICFAWWDIYDNFSCICPKLDGKRDIDRYISCICPKSRWKRGT